MICSFQAKIDAKRGTEGPVQMLYFGMNSGLNDKFSIFLQITPRIAHTTVNDTVYALLPTGLHP